MSESLFELASYKFSSLKKYFNTTKPTKRAHTFAIEVFSDATDWKSGTAVTMAEFCPENERIELSSFNPIFHYRPELSPALEWAIDKGHILKGGTVVYICTNDQRKIDEIGDITEDYVNAGRCEIYACRKRDPKTEELDVFASLEEVNKVLAYVAFRRKLPDSDPDYLDAVTLVIDDGTDYEEWFMDMYDIVNKLDKFGFARDYRTYGARKKQMKLFVNDIMSKIHGHLIYLRKQKAVTDISHGKKKKKKSGDSGEETSKSKKFALDQEDMRTPDGMKELHFELSMSLRHFRPDPDSDPLVKIVRTRYHPTEATDIGTDENGEPYFEPDYPYFRPSFVNLFDIMQRSIFRKIHVWPPEGVEILYGPEEYFSGEEEEE
jgi:hypothetical protein